MSDPGKSKPFTSATAVAVAECKPPTFRAWVNRNGLFRRGDELPKDAWSRFSMVDIYVLRTVVVLTEMGIAAQTAVDAARGMRPHFEELLSQPDTASAVAVLDVTPGDHGETAPHIETGRDTTPLLQVMRNAEFGGRFGRGAAISIDMLAIVEDVHFNLAQLDPEPMPHIMSKRETRRFVAGVLARALAPEPEDDPQ